MSESKKLNERFFRLADEIEELHNQGQLDNDGYRRLRYDMYELMKALEVHMK